MSSNVFVWQRCPRTCGTCPRTCPSGLDPSASFLIKRVGVTQPYRLLSWWYVDIARLGWQQYKSVATPKLTTTRRVPLKPGGVFLSDGFASAVELGWLGDAMDSWREGVEWQLTSVNGAKVRMAQSSMAPDAAPDWASGQTYPLLRELLARMIAAVNLRVEVVGSTLGASHSFQRRVGYHLTQWAVYQYEPGATRGAHEVRISINRCSAI